jgi:hypothetical protein
MPGVGSVRFGAAGVVPATGYVHSLLLWAQALHVELTPLFTPKFGGQ